MDKKFYEPPETHRHIVEVEGAICESSGIRAPGTTGMESDMVFGIDDQDDGGDFSFGDDSTWDN